MTFPDFVPANALATASGGAVMVNAVTGRLASSEADATAIAARARTAFDAASRRE